MKLSKRWLIRKLVAVLDIFFQESFFKNHVVYYTGRLYLNHNNQIIYLYNFFDIVITMHA